MTEQLDQKVEHNTKFSWGAFEVGRNFLFAFIFLVLVTINYWWPLTGLNDLEKIESREMASQPEFHLDESILLFPLDYENYYLDHFKIRNWLLAFDVNIRYRIFDQKLYRDVIVGENNFLFFRLPEIVNGCQKVNQLTTQQQEALISRLQKTTTWLNDRGVQLFVTIAPNKCTIYPEYSNQDIPILGEITDYEIFEEAVRQNGGINLIDLQQLLLDSKSEERLLYQQTDTHWNDFGAYIVYREIVRQLLPEIQEKELIVNEKLIPHNYNISYSEGRYFPFIEDFVTPSTWYTVKGNAVLKSDAKGIAVYENPFAGNDLTLIVYQDSFFYMRSNALEPQYLDAYHRHVFMRVLLAENFAKTIFFSRNLNLNWSHDKDYLAQVLETYDPDIILVESVERGLFYLARAVSQELISATTP